MRNRPLNYRIRVYGKVQGVFFRANAVRVATDLGITGWVKNEVDGSVQITAEGQEEQMQQLLSWCEKGPAYASVNRVDFSENDLENFKSFRIIN